jgi:hypothetical protein
VSSIPEKVEKEGMDAEQGILTMLSRNVCCKYPHFEDAGGILWPIFLALSHFCRYPSSERKRGLVSEVVRRLFDIFTRLGGRVMSSLSGEVQQYTVKTPQDISQAHDAGTRRCVKKSCLSSFMYRGPIQRKKDDINA